MNPMCGELKVPLTDAKIVGDNVPSDVYFRQEAGAERGTPAFVMSRGSLMEFARCPERWINGYESEETKATEWGSLIDCLVLTPDKFKERFAITPAMYPCEPTKRDPRTEKPWNANSNFCAEWEELQIGKQIVKPAKLTEAENAVKFLMGNEQIRQLIKCSRKQVMAVAAYHEVETGIDVSLKVLIDLVPELGTPFEKCLADLKTAVAASYFLWGRAVKQHDYHVQAALYSDVYRAATGEDRPDWFNAVQESFPPWQTATWALSSEYVEIGRMKYLDALKKYCQCLKADVWPGYQGGNLDWNGWKYVNPEPWMIE